MGGDSLSVPILYEANATDFNNLGLGPLPETITATVTEERNGQFILEMQYPVDGIRASLIAKNRILKVDAGHKLKDQRFVIKRINRIMGNDGLSYSIYAEHISYITADYALKPNLTVNGSGNVAMTQWLNGIIDSNRIHVDSDITTENTTSWTIDKVQNARQALGGVQGSILDVWGGEYRFDNLNISLLRHRGTVSNTLLSYGRNITDFDQEENITNTYTSIYPFASYSVQNGDTSEQKILTIPNLVVDSEYVNNFPNRKIQVVDFSDKFSTDEKPTVERLAELAKSYIKSNNVGVPTVSTKISFVDLSKTENYKEFAPLEELDLCDEVPFAFEKFGIKTTAKISRIVWNVLLDSYDSLELGELKTNLSDVINNTNNAALDAKDAANDAKNSADNAALSANGKNRNWYGADDPAFGHLSELREGDSWYKPNGEDTELYYWENGQWVFILSTKDTHEAKDAADAAQKEAEEAKTQANKAVDGANDAVAKAGFANDTATQAKSDAAAAGQQAKNALTSAGTAITDAQNALTNSSSAMADSTQARKDSATAKIQAANAATQANQAVTDATTAKADANTAKINATQAINDAATAKGQATNALGQANTAINNAANALNKVNNMQVGGRNYILNSDNYLIGAGKQQIHVGDISGDTLKKLRGKQVTISVDVDYTNARHEVGLKCRIGTEFAVTYVSGTRQYLGVWKQTTAGESYSGRISQTMVFKDEPIISTSAEVSAYAQDVFDESSVGRPKLEIGTTFTDWSPAPEDVQQQFTDINGELSQKVSQTTYNVLAGTVDTVNTLAKQNQSTISTLATKNSVDTVNHTATAAQTLAQQNATELLNKANSTTVNTLTQRVTTAESTLSQTATKAELALTKTDVDKLGDSVASQALDIAATADGLKLKADSSTISDLAGTVAQNSAQLGLTATKADLALTQNDVNGLDDTVNKQATQLALTATKAELQVAQTNVDNLKKTVTSNTAGMTANANALKLKADSSTVSSLDGRVTNLSGQLDVQADKIAATVTASDVTGMLNGYATQTWTQNEIKVTANEFSSTLETVQTQVQDSSVGTNLYRDTRDFDNPDIWSYYSVWHKATEKINGLTVMAANTSWFGLGQDVQVKKGEIYTFSLYSRYESGTGKSNMYFLPNGSTAILNRANVQVSLNEKWQRISATFTVLGDGTIHPRFERSADNTNTLLIAGFKLERGSVMTDYSVSPLDTATVTAVSKISQTVDGIQTTVSGKADKSQVTQLAGQITSVVGDVSANSSQITQMKADINLRVKAGDVINQINISPESILIAGQKVHITGQTSIDNAVIKDAMIADIKADKITAGTLNAANVNVINLNANNITTGTIKGANLSLNLNTGEVLFQKGSIKSTNGNLNIRIDDGSMSLTNSLGNGAYFKDGNIYMTDSDLWTPGNPKIQYGTLKMVPNFLSDAGGGVALKGPNGVVVGTDEYPDTGILGDLLSSISGGGITLTKEHIRMASEGDIGIVGGKMYNSGFAGELPAIQVGIAGSNTAPMPWFPSGEIGDALFLSGKVVGVVASNGTGNLMTNTISDLSASCDARSGYVLSAATYKRTYGSGATATITPNGVFGRISSASKYKLAIGEISTLNDEAHQFLSVKPKQWFDKSESEALADSMTTGNTDYVDDAKALPHNGFIAEDLYTAGLDSYVIRGNDGSIESIQYDRLPVLHHELIRELFNRLDAAEMEIYKLKQEVLNNAN